MIKNLFLMVLSIMLITTVFTGCLDDSETEEREDAVEYYPPGITITSPKYNKQVSGTVGIEISVNPSTAVLRIQYFLDDVLLETTTDTSLEWDTTMVDNGKYDISISALEIGPHVPLDVLPTQKTTKVRVYNEPYIPPEENEPPTIQLNVPAGDIEGVYGGSVTINGEVDDLESDLETIEMKIDYESWFDIPVSRNKWHYTLEPASFTGQVEISVRAYDGEDFSEIKTITIECDNTPPEIEILNPAEFETIGGIVTLSTQVNDHHAIKEIVFLIGETELQRSPLDSYDLNTHEY